MKLIASLILKKRFRTALLVTAVSALMADFLSCKELSTAISWLSYNSEKAFNTILLVKNARNLLFLLTIFKGPSAFLYATVRYRIGLRPFIYSVLSKIARQLKTVERRDPLLAGAYSDAGAVMPWRPP
jgi:hypothetical protein